jgi:hypothetical protein
MLAALSRLAPETHAHIAELVADTLPLGADKLTYLAQLFARPAAGNHRPASPR